MTRVELINNLARCFHDIYSARRIRMATERHLIVTYGKVQFFTSDGCHSGILHLTSYVFLRLIGVPWSPRG